MAASAANETAVDRGTLCCSRWNGGQECADDVETVMNNNLSLLTSTLDGVSDQPHAPATLNPEEMSPILF